MTKIILPKSILPDFESAKGPTEVRDSAGETLGWFLPGLSQLPDGSSITVESVRHALANPGGRSVSEVWRSLGVEYKEQ